MVQNSSSQQSLQFQNTCKIKMELLKSIGGYLLGYKQGIIYNDSKFDAFFTIHQANKPCPFLQIEEQEINTTNTREQIKKKIQNIQGVHQVSSKDYITAGLDNIKLNGQSKISIIFQNGYLVQNSFKITSIENIQLKITEDNAVTTLIHEQAEKLKVLATSTKIPQKSNCFLCLSEGVHSLSTAIKIRVENSCYYCKKNILDGVFYVCKKYPILHIFCNTCNSKNTKKSQFVNINPENQRSNQKQTFYSKAEEQSMPRSTRSKSQEQSFEIVNGVKYFKQSKIGCIIQQSQIYY